MNEIERVYRTREEKKQAAVAVLMHGSVRQAHKALSEAGVEIPEKTIYAWVKQKTWPEIMDEVRRENLELIEGRLCSVVEKATWALLDRLENGDVVVNARGEERRIPVKARDLGTIAANFLDKLRIHRNQPTNVTANVEFNADSLVKQFAEIAEKHREKVVSEQ